MSRPYQFSDPDQRVTSPLDRRQQEPAPGQPPSFRTNVNRAKTKKWVEAKQVSYGGDDWDDYDEDDEYGVGSAVEERPPPLASPQSRSFTTPVPGSEQASQLQRTNSFERGDERRAFSSSNAPEPAQPRSSGPPLHVDTAVQPQQQAQATDSPSVYSTSGTRQASAASYAQSTTSDNSMNPQNRRDFSPSAMPPPLKATPSPGPQSPVSPSKALHFIRPSDIYKRIEEEKEREHRTSLESSRSQEVASPTKPAEPAIAKPEPRLESSYRMGAPLETVTERKSEYGMPGLPAITQPSASGFTGISLPALGSESSFGSFWDKPSQDSAPAQDTQPANAGLQHQPSVGYRSMVNQAFDAPAKVSKQDSTRSQAPTESSGVSRSDTEGTADISPIMSRVPSSATSALKHAEQHDTPPAIAEEPETDDRGRAADSAALADVKPGYRRDLNPPSGANSPARSPVVEVRKQLHDPASAAVLSSPESAKAVDATFREADLAAQKTSLSPERPSASVAAFEKAAQDSFIATHDAPAEASPAIARSESPTKGRVADLAGKFNEAGPDSRRNSVQSIDSKKSASSWDASSRPSSSHATKAGDRPTAEREASFRPKLPGGFESYASTAPAQSIGAPTPTNEATKDFDLEPTTTKHAVEGKNITSPGTSAGGPMAALAAAGAAVAAAITGAAAKETDNEDSASSARATGDIYNRPLPPDRLESTASTIPPTPPAKDDVEPPTVKHDVARESGDFESDRLRRDIVRTLSPTQEERPAQAGLEVPETRAPNRSSDVLSEYESYWAGDDDEEEELKMAATALPTFSPAPLAPKAAAVPEVEKELPKPVEEKAVVPEAVPAPPVPAPKTVTGPASSAQPGFLTQRFSWEMTPAESPVVEEPVPKAAEPAAQVTSAPQPPSDKLKPTDPLTLNPKLSSEHLQIRNAEPGELPSPDEVRVPSLDSTRGPSSQVAEPQVDTPVSPLIVTPTRETPAGPRPPSGHKPQDGHDVRPPSFREILAIKQTPVRIAKYNETRLQFGTMDTGLEHWLRATSASNPELRNIQNAPYRPTAPTVTTTGASPSGARHKTASSLNRVFSGQGDKLSSPADSVPEYRPSPSSSDRTAAAAALKGKDLLNKAGVLGGKGVSKGMKEAKGLFAKGKSRFRGSGSEKAPCDTSSRRSSIASISSQSSIFSLASSRRSSFESTPPASRRNSAELIVNSLCRSPSSSSLNDLKLPGPKKPSPDDADAPWSDDWLRENVNFDVMAIFSRRKNTKIEDDEETIRNTKLNSGRPVTPRENGMPFAKPGDLPTPALPQFAFEGSRPSSRNGSSENLVKGIMKHPNGSNTAVGPIPPRQPMPSKLSIPDPGGKAGDRKSHTRVVSMIGLGDGHRDTGDPPSPVSPVDDEDRFPRGGPNGKHDGARSGALRASSAMPRMPGAAPPNASLSPASVSPMLRPHSAVGVVDAGPGPRVSFALSNEPKGKEKAVSGSTTPVTAAARHIRFDSNSFHPKAKEIKLQKQKAEMEAAAKQQANGTHRPGGFLQVINPATKAPQQKRAAPESGALSNLHRADSQFDRMAAIANAHRMMREHFDETDDLAQAPPDLMASETAARMRAKQEELEKMAGMMSGGMGGIPIPPIPEERPQSSDGRTRSRANSAVSYNSRSSSREPRPLTVVGTPGQSRDSSRSASRQRLAPSGARSSSIPRPESIVGLPVQSDGRRRSLTNDGPHPITLDTSTHMLSMSKGNSPATPSGLSTLPSQQRPISQAAQLVSQDTQANPRLSAGPGPTIRNDQQNKSGSSTPSMVFTTPDHVSSMQQSSPPAKGYNRGSQASSAGQSLHSVSSLGDGTEQSGNVSPANGKRGVSPVRKSFEKRKYYADSKKERPMSFVPLERDSQGLPVSETISTARNAIDGSTPEDEESNEDEDEPVSRAESRNNEHQKPPSSVPSRTVSAQSSYEDELYEPPTPKPTSFQGTESAPASKSTSREGPPQQSDSPLRSNPVKHRSIQLYDRPFSRDDYASPSTVGPDANPIEHQQTPTTPSVKKGGLLSKLKGKPPSGSPVDLSPHSQQSSRDTTASSGDQRLSSMTSTTASIDIDPKEKQKRRGSGFFSLKRPSSAEPLAVHENNDIGIPAHNQVRLNDSAGPSPTNAKPQRSATTHANEGGKKRRGTLGGIFSRNQPTQPVPPSQPPQKVSAKTTVFHRVPNNPNPGAWEAQQEQERRQRFSGPRGADSGKPPIPVNGSMGDYYGQNQAGRPPSQDGPPSQGNKPPSFVHNPGASGMAAIAAQRDYQVTTTITGASGYTEPSGRKERRSMSLTGGGLFGRKRTDSSPANPNRERSDSTESSTKLKKGGKRNMGSISESGSVHQERPWAITLPGAEGPQDEEEREIERREIMHASSIRWQRGSDGQMYALQDPSPGSLTGSTPISPQSQPFPGQGGQAGPQNPVFSYLPSGVPAQQPGRVEEQERRAQDYYGPRSTAPPPVHYPQQHRGYEPEKPETYQPSPPSQPIIPPLPQENVPLMQPQPRRTSWQAGVTDSRNDPRKDPSYRSGGAARSTTTTAATSTSPRVLRAGGLPRVDLPSQSLSNGAPGQGSQGYGPNHNVASGMGSREHLSNYANRESDAPENRPPVPSKDSLAPSPRVPSRGSSSTPPSRGFVSAMEEERRKHGDHTAMGYTGSKAKRERAGLHVNVPVTGGPPPPQVGVFSDTAAAVASTGTSARHRRASDHSDDDAPVMKATSFPGDEWVPEFYYE